MTDGNPVQEIEQMAFTDLNDPSPMTPLHRLDEIPQRMTEQRHHIATRSVRDVDSRRGLEARVPVTVKPALRR